ncbi:TIGR01244 family sulfur transferase [Aestuariivita boseongensis]|uniref:TIGR01244 family sulfur transferase n=1 Tax=Aestuariivita boseongensis TaxID=1470562 RepID=UPI000680B9BC|nr:TIGR01244 family sulfur transferase [Aestuariivita boseongensis]
MERTQLAENLYVGSQIAETDLAALKQDGFTDVICNRPDEEHPGEAASAEMQKIATNLGLAFHYQPIAPGEPFARQASFLKRIVTQPGKKVFAYCRSGARSTNAWNLVETSSANT